VAIDHPSSYHYQLDFRMVSKSSLYAPLFFLLQNGRLKSNLKIFFQNKNNF